MGRLLAFLDPLLGGAALVVEAHDRSIREREIRHDEADAGEQLTDVMLDFCHDSPGVPRQNLLELTKTVSRRGARSGGKGSLMLAEPFR